MNKVHARNGGYVGVNYKRSFPSGVHVIGGVGRVTKIEIDVELYGGKGADFYRSAFMNKGYGGNGGYTKLRIKTTTDKTLQIRPVYQPGGAAYNGSTGGIKGGDGAALLINNEWIAIAGGGGGGGGKNFYQFSNSSFVSENGNNGAAGFGGYGTGLPSAGSTGSSCSYYDNNDSPQYFGQSQSGGGGGGAPGGDDGGTGCYGSFTNAGPDGGGGGGGGNLRIYKDQSVLSGYLSVLPDVYMAYTTHQNGSHNGTSTVKLTNASTSANNSYTTSLDLKAIYVQDGVFTP